MNRNFAYGKAVVVVLLAILVIATEAAAQQQTAALVTAMAANAKQLRQYTFKQRTEMYHNGELKNAKVDEVHYSVVSGSASRSTNNGPSQRRPGADLATGSSPKRLKKRKRR